ncbi:hypothetical protein FSP39_015439, partial [Pinctada imbricata]
SLTDYILNSKMDEFDQENRSYPEEKFMTRKSKKPLMEKRRRARINNCLSQLKALVLQAMKKDTTHYSKLEKADILEMTVKYLRNLQRRQISSAVAADPTVAAKFTVGFNECASEVVRYLNNAHGINEDVRGRLLGHISNCVQNTNSQQMQNLQMGQAFMQPLHVQIPAAQNGLGVNHTQPESLLTAPQTMFQSSGLSHINSSYSVSPDAVFTARLNTSSNRGSESVSVEQKPFSRIPSQCSTNSVPLGNSEMVQSKIVSGHQRLSVHFPESISPERVGFRPPMISTPEHKMQRFSTSPEFASASAALKEEKLWRPW